MRNKVGSAIGVFVLASSFLASMTGRAERVPPLVVGHRGASAYYPENTLLSFKQALALNAEAIECDVHMTKDGEIVVIHDPEVDRTTSGHGQVRNLTLAELKKLDAGRGEKIPTLDELLSWFVHQPFLRLFLEVKIGSQPYPGMAEKIGQALHKFGVVDRVLVISFHYEELEAIHSLYPEIATGALYEEGQFPIQDLISKALALHATAVLPDHQLLTSRLVSEAHKKKLSVFTWTVDRTKDIKRVQRLNVDGIISNMPDVVVHELKSN